MLILDEPTNHLDVDAREALVQALNDYEGAVVLVSHDRHMLELTADRLVLVDGGRATEFAGSMDDYTDMILGKTPSKGDGAKGGNRKEDRKAAAQAREKLAQTRKQAKDAEAQIEKLSAERSAVDAAMFDPSKASPAHAKLTMTELMKLRATLSDQIDDAEARWLEATGELETAD